MGLGPGLGRVATAPRSVGAAGTEQHGPGAHKAGTAFPGLRRLEGCEQRAGGDSQGLRAASPPSGRDQGALRGVSSAGTKPSLPWAPPPNGIPLGAGGQHMNFGTHTLRTALSPTGGRGREPAERQAAGRTLSYRRRPASVLCRPVTGWVRPTPSGEGTRLYPLDQFQCYSHPGTLRSTQNNV